MFLQDFIHISQLRGIRHQVYPIEERTNDRSKMTMHIITHIEPDYVYDVKINSFTLLQQLIMNMTLFHRVITCF